MAFATAIDGSKLFYRLDGPDGAPVVLFSNSLGTDHTLWDVQAANLTSRYRVLRYDTRGHGQSDAPAGEYDMVGLARDVIGLLDHLGIEKVRFCGLSMGGAIGQWLGSHAASRIERLVLANTGAVFGTPATWQTRMDAVTAGGMAAVVDGVLDRWFTDAFRQAEPAAVEAVKALLLSTPAQGYAGCCAALRDTDFRRFLPEVSVPTLVIGGIHDGASPPERAGELADNIPDARLVMLEASHLSVIEQPALFDAALVGFLE